MYRPSPKTTCDDILFDSAVHPSVRGDGASMRAVAGALAATFAVALVGASLLGALGGGLTALALAQLDAPTSGIAATD